MFTLIILYLILTVINGFVLKNRFLKHKWSIFNYAYCYLILFYNIAPLFIYLAKYFSIDYKKVYIEPSFSIHLEADFLIYIIICVFFIVYNLSFTSLYRNKKINVTKFKNIKIEKRVVLFFLLLSGISLILYITGFGSFSNAILNADMIRSGTFKESNVDKDTSYTIFQRFINLAIIPFLYFFFLKKNKEPKNYYYFIISTIIIFISYTFLSGSRQSIIDLFLIFLLANLIEKNKIINYKLIIVFFLAIYILPLLDSLFISLSYDNNIDFKKEEVNVFEILINEFGFPFYSLYYAIIENHNFNYFSDFYVDLFGNFFPSSWGPSIKTSNYLNSYYTQGLFDKGYVPPGLIAQGYYSLGFIGVIVISFFTSYIFKKMDVFFVQLKKINLGFVLFYSFFIVKSLAWVRTGLPGNYFYNTVLVFCFIFVVFFIRKR